MSKLTNDTMQAIEYQDGQDALMIQVPNECGTVRVAAVCLATGGWYGNELTPDQAEGREE